MRYKNTYVAFHGLSITVSEFILIISFKNQVESGLKLHLVKKKKKNLKTLLRWIHIFFTNKIYFWILSEQNANNVWDILMWRPLVMIYASLLPVGTSASSPPLARGRESSESTLNSCQGNSQHFMTLWLDDGEIDWPVTTPEEDQTA